ncbi:Stk1 family PASTA domain-containing Ser/Thr kinase [Arcanobacterium haemolyticum]|nr:Stk1 family PASTA domain-containing Ser/Thr kinase [Arcanobacterium haemolyticum]
MEQTDPLIGTIVDGRYLITDHLGRGGMATVYLARDKRLERDVALKLMHPHLANMPDFTDRFNKEARSVARLSSQWVVSVHDQGVWSSPHGAQAYLVMEYIPGPDVRTELSRLGSFTIGTALNIVEQTFQALATAHRAGLIHRDVKPENILLQAPLESASVFDQQVIHAKVADFGLARAVSATTTASVPMGTVAYMAPEAISSGKVEAPADVYAVGIMLYEFLTGTLPFHGETAIATAYQHVNAPIPRIADSEDWFPPALDSFIGLLTAKSPHERPRDGAAALDALHDVLATIPEEMRIRRIPVIPHVRPSSGETLALPDTASSAALPRPVSPSESEPDTPIAHTLKLDTLAHAPDPGPQEHSTRESTTHALTPASEHEAGNPVSVRKRKAPLVAVVVLFLAAIFAGWFYLAGPGHRIDVPSVEGQSFDDAKAKLSEHGFTVERREAYSDTVANGLVISTDPAGGDKAHPSTPIAVTVSLGIEQVTVPDLTGTTEVEAQTAVADARLTWQKDEAYSETVAAGSVISQSIESGRLVDHDSAITVTISKGREPIPVPTVVGASRDAAVASIEKLGLTATVTEEFSDDVPQGNVISQDPSTGTRYRGDAISVVVSKGPELIEVPNVVGMSESKARETLESAGFQVKVDSILIPILKTIYSQSPGAGQMAPVGSVVTISKV